MDKILTLSKANKIKLEKYFYGGSHYLGKSLMRCRKHELNSLLLLTIETPIDLCRFLKTSFLQLSDEINNPVYHHYTIPKKKGGEREIFAPSKNLKRLQKRLNYFFQAYYLWIKPDAVHGFVVNPHYMGTYCNIVANAAAHTQKKYVLNIDMKDFFPSISALRVKNIFTSANFNFNEQIATALTLLTTYEGKLPIGAPTSPVISNFICLKLDNDLKLFCEENHLTFTRYADDLTFSWDDIISDDDILDIYSLIKKNNFQVNEKKLRLKTSNRKQTVTGLTVNDKVNVDRRLLKKIRAMLHDVSTNGIAMATRSHFKLKSVSKQEQ
ncbi:MAG: reverse transcriptase family protein, partial [Ignavibacteria bacterium]|nr:reverse transcriptase family protein [Ignavibacteria bacterium]